MSVTQPNVAARAAENAVLTKATLRAAELMDITARTLASIIGVSEATVSRMRRQEFLLERGTKPFELAVLFVRLFRSLDAIVGGAASDPQFSRSLDRNGGRTNAQ